MTFLLPPGIKGLRMNWWIELIFLHVNTYSGKLKINNYNVGVVKNEVGLLDHETPCVFQELFDELNWFFTCGYKFRKSKNYLCSYWMIVVNYGDGFLGNGTFLYLKNDLGNWADYLCAGSNAIILVRLSILPSILDF